MRRPSALNQRARNSRVSTHAKAQFRSLAEPWADTGTSTGRLMLAVLGGLAGVERDLIRNPDGRGQKPRQGPWAADGPTPGTQSGAAERGHPPLHGGRYA
jgi:DNA invertase Pin-like site-specific DNA recombinase